MRAIAIAWALAILAAVSAMLAPNPARADEVYVIDGEVWDYFQKYLDRTNDGNKPGAFAITTDGTGAYYIWCEEIRCVSGPTYSHEAKSSCEREYDTDCVVFAVREDIKVQYEIRKVGGGSSSSAPDLAPAPMTRIAVSAATQAEIDKYLRNATGGSKAWALAIAKDGSAVASANCQTTGGGGYFGGGGTCDLNKGTAQELANKEALKRCGGPADCMLLYVGQQKTANIEIVAPGAAITPAPSTAPAAVAAAPEPAPQSALADSAPPSATPVLAPAPATTNVDPEPSAAAPDPVVASAAPEPEPAPLPMTRIAVSDEAQATIDKYLRNAKASGRAWALAIAKDGAAAAAASCPLGGSYSGGTACEPVKGSAQELARREALKRCGGPAECVLLYVGEQKAAMIEIVAR